VTKVYARLNEADSNSEDICNECEECDDLDQGCLPTAEHLQQRSVCQRQMNRNIRKDLNARVPIIAGYENACQRQPVSCSMINTENLKSRWNNCEERDLGY